MATIVETKDGSFVHDNPTLLIFSDGQAAKIDLRKGNKLSSVLEKSLSSRTDNGKLLRQLDEMARKSITAEIQGQEKHYIGLLKMYPDIKEVAVFELDYANEVAVRTWINDRKWLKKEKKNPDQLVSLKDVIRLDPAMSSQNVDSKSIRELVRGRTVKKEISITRMYKNMRAPIFLMFNDGSCFKCFLNTKNVPNEFAHMLMFADFYAHESPDFDKEQDVLKLLNNDAHKKKDTKHDIGFKVIQKKHRKDYSMKRGGFGVALIRHEDDPHGANKETLEHWRDGKLSLAHVMCLCDFDPRESADKLKALLIEKRLTRAQEQNKQLYEALLEKDDQIAGMEDGMNSRVNGGYERDDEYDSSEERKLNAQLLEAERRERELKKRYEELLAEKTTISTTRSHVVTSTPAITRSQPSRPSTQLSSPRKSILKHPSRVSAISQTNFDKWNPIPISSESEEYSQMPTNPEFHTPARNPPKHRMRTRAGSLSSVEPTTNARTFRRSFSSKRDTSKNYVAGNSRLERSRDPIPVSDSDTHAVTQHKSGSRYSERRVAWDETGTQTETGSAVADRLLERHKYKHQKHVGEPRSDMTRKPYSKRSYHSAYNRVGA